MVLARGNYEKCRIENHNEEIQRQCPHEMAAFSSRLLQQLASLGVILGNSPRVFLRELVFCISLWLLVI